MRSTNGDEIVPCTEEEEERRNEEDEEEDANRTIPIRSTETSSGQKRSLRRGFSKLVIASKRRKREKNKKNSNSTEGGLNDSVRSSSGSRSQISSVLLPPCCSRPQYLAPDSPLSDHAFQSLIERNDFYSAQCNVHHNLSASTRNHGC